MATAQPRPTLQSIFAAQARIAPHVRRTPLIPIGHALGHANNFRLKCEFLQVSGAFKARGAANRILTLPEEARRRGVVTVSTGNHGRAVATVAAGLGIKATVCVSKQVPQHKLARFDGTGADLRVVGNSQDEAALHAFELVRTEGLALVHPFDDPEIIAGQGTIGLEVLEDFPEISVAVVGVGGGGLIAGTALALKSANPAIRVIGVQMDRNPVMFHSLKAGRPIEMPELPTLADSLAGGIFLDNAYSFPMVRDLVDEIVLVSEEEIAAAMAGVFHQSQYVLEGAAAVGVAALLAGKVRVGDTDAVVTVGSGGGISVESLLKCIEGR